ncbi:hypothetical protein AGLY_011569 [Aphis glycines]|uniref:USP domain-containing protein n=1 Tax=Aphis glycines TaxID=307491 RepID=A0A6G0TCA9_APHGL|nr:hypothetical protein AGLY_011569 [Aphis glycines]
MLKPMAVRGEMDPKYDDIFFDGLNEYYSCRPHSLEDVTLAEFGSNYEVRVEETQLDDNEIQIEGEQGRNNNQLVDDEDWVPDDVLINDVGDYVENTNSSDVDSPKDGGHPAMKVFVTGPAVAGKSMFIRALAQSVIRIANLRPDIDDLSLPPVLLTAPTGKAAYGIKGLTLHSAFKLPLNQFVGLLPKLSSDISNTLRVFGDFFQLAPVLGTPLYDSFEKILSTFPSVVEMLSIKSVWETFKFYELTEIMRQKDDKQFAIMLTKLARGQLEETDVKYFQNLITHVYITFQPQVMHLWATNYEVNEMNRRVLNSMNQVSFMSKAIDTSAKRSDIESAKKLPRQKTMGSALRLVLKETAKYMVIANISTEDSIVNGAIGELMQINKGQTAEGKEVAKRVWIKFDEPDVGSLTRQKIKNKLKPEGEHTDDMCKWTPIEIIKLEFQLDHGTTIDNVIINVDIAASVYESLISDHRPILVMVIDTFKEIEKYSETVDDQIVNSNTLKVPENYNIRSDSLLETISDNATVSKNPKTIKISSIKNKVDITLSSTFCGFTNTDGVSCYANSVIQVLCQSLVNEIRNNQLGPTLQHSLHEYTSNSGSCDTRTIREYLDNETILYTLQQQQDCIEFLEVLMNRSRPTFESLFGFQELYTIRCNTCKHTTANNAPTSLILHFEIQQHRSQTLQILFSTNQNVWNTLDDYKCNNCNNIGSSEDKHQIIVENEYIVIQLKLFIPTFVNGQFVPNKMT